MIEHLDIPENPMDFKLENNAGPCPDCDGWDIDVALTPETATYKCNDCSKETVFSRREYNELEEQLRFALRVRNIESDE